MTRGDYVERGIFWAFVVSVAIVLLVWVAGRNAYIRERERTSLVGQPCAHQSTAQLEYSMAPHQERVVAEKAELDEKLHKLIAFHGTATFNALPDGEQARLIRQSKVMSEYSAVLGERIAAF